MGLSDRLTARQWRRSRTARAAILVSLMLAFAGCDRPPASSSPGSATMACVGGVSQATCDDAARVALATVAASGWTPTHIWVNSGVFCPRQDCLFDPRQNFPYPAPPNNGTWVANVEIAFAETDRHAGLMIDQVGTSLVPVLIGYRVPRPGWCSGKCP
jgi:hypothetical protein